MSKLCLQVYQRLDSGAGGGCGGSKGPSGKHSSVYQEFSAELGEILKHKWLESEKAKRDVGFEWALMDWSKQHREKWRNARRGARGCDGTGDAKAS
jgi:hypothetical protein